ncbi:MAG: RagB/SusD family nutrient uptake outer membrane protein [Niastella sp.]|nr:RagB/SusD family nutrient uptake outer membrane protein [Niastella sp.]
MNKLQKMCILFLAASIVGTASCNKKEFLEAKPNSELFVPTTLDDFQALLDNDVVMNETPVLGDLSADNFYTPISYWQGLGVKEKNTYIWNPETFEGLAGNIPDWNTPYTQAFYANVILESLSKLPITNSNINRWKAIKGAALFARAHAFYQVAQLFAPVYNSNNSGENQGIPLRLTPGVDETSVRSSLQVTYNRIVDDLREASNLLPKEIPFANRNRSSRPAAFALLARVYLSMDKYLDAKKYSDSCLQLHNVLIKYDTLNYQANIPFTKFNAETIYHSQFITGNLLRGLSIPNCIVDSSLYRSYEPNDLRSATFYRIHPTTNNINPKGSYTGTNQLFTGLATDEVYLIRAECEARLGNTQAAMNDLNHLLAARWKANTFVPLSAPNADSALKIILIERRKELPFRGLRWTDLRRFNKAGANITLIRKLGNQTYELKPNDLRYTLLIPPDVIVLSGIPQNPR